MLGTTAYNRFYNSYNLPPMTVKKSVKRKDSWKMAVMDGFERIAVDQFMENLEFTDLYRMVEGKLTYQELSDVAPHFADIQNVLEGVGIPTFLRHYDIIGVIVKGLTGILIQMQDKFHVTDTGEVAQSEFLRFQNDKIRQMLEGVLQNSIDLRLAEAGYDKDLNKFQSDEEKQAYVAELQAAKERFTPKDTLSASKKSFKTTGITWGEATLDQDRERFNFNYLDKEDFRHYLISGRCFRHFRIGFDSYEPETWSAKNTFFSKEVNAKFAHKGEYVGNIDFLTPSQVVRVHGHLIDTNTQIELLGGNKGWGEFMGDDLNPGSIQAAIASNFNKQTRTPFSGYEDYNFYLALQEETGVPLGVQTLFNTDGTTTTKDRFLPKLAGHQKGSVYDGYANMLRDDFNHRTDLCQVTEVYFRAYDRYGYLTYTDDFGTVVTEEVTEDILPEFLKENNIKQTYKESLVDIVKGFEAGTLQWILRPVVYKGIKVQSANLKDPLYLQCEPWEHEIKGDSEFDRYLPVAGYIGEGIAKKIEPYQAKHNLCMNQVYSLLEKELGIFFLMDVAMIPSEYAEWGNAQDAFMAIRNIAKETGIMPVANTPDGQGPASTFNQFSSYNLSNSGQIADRIKLAEFTQRKAYEVIGINQTILQQPTKYETAEGVKQSQEAGYAQLAEIFENFNIYRKAALELHLSVAQYAQTQKKDSSMYFTKSDGSIEYLKMQDPSFPLRKIGLIATMDSSKRKELETFKSLLINNNTLGSDTLELAKLIASDGMAEAIEIAKFAQERAQAREDGIRRENAQVAQSQLEGKAQIDQATWEREELSKAEDRKTKIQVAEITALGRASDKKSDVTGMEVIKASAEHALKSNKLDNDQEIALGKMKLEETKNTTDANIRMEELKLKAKQLGEKMAERKSREYVATVNKN